MDSRKLRELKATANFYGFESVVEQMPAFAQLKKRRPIAELQLCAGFVWAQEGGAGKCYAVEPANSKDCSQCLYASRTIKLARKHRNVGALLHELSHALGHPHDKLDHGPAFRKRCIRLYKQYGGWSGEVSFEKGA